MNGIKTIFSIKDLENLSGIKAHTIRIWEKRYNLFSPKRTDTNIRFYSQDTLIKLLNITLLYENGFKISKISRLTETEIISNCKSIISEKAVKNRMINDLKLAMLNFDQPLFEEVYQKLARQYDFQDIYVSYFIPFLSEIGLLWHTHTINPAHEHFITSLIKQKILIATEKLLGTLPKYHDRRFILFLPLNEIHEIGLVYANYEILKSGYSTIYLGQSLPISSLKSFLNSSNEITFVTYFTVEPKTNKIYEYLDEIHGEILSKCNGELWVLGSKTNEIEKDKLPDKINILKVEEMMEKLNEHSKLVVK
ncbi:DNA-binding transcriptional MerR regulator [Saonia flava]|uniref:DNA-binding transcriptional MerR regulator n=1 Tax=Saonia flava TaxID=523696 RepID=A0A846QUP0_9FLAO|nr:MerR family transcriptional regulator [Saonia flava]NJB71748.1 DNA-binding transcriptional MerR regulator [Saonia flava]